MMNPFPQRPHSNLSSHKSQATVQLPRTSLALQSHSSTILSGSSARTLSKGMFSVASRDALGCITARAIVYVRSFPRPLPLGENMILLSRRMLLPHSTRFHKISDETLGVVVIRIVCQYL